MAESKLWILYHIKKKSYDGQEKTYFDRVGHANLNKNGSFNVWLETLPVGLDGETTFNLQPYKPKEKSEADGFSE